MRYTKRLNSELKNLKSIGAYIIHEEEHITIYFQKIFNKTIKKIQDKKHIEPLLSIKIKDDYIFRGPIFKYFDKDIHSIYRISLCNEFIELLNSSNTCLLCNRVNCPGCSCMCCSTLVCKNNWGPTIRLTDVIDEFKKYIQIKCRLVERFHCKKIQNKYLYKIPTKYLPIHNYL